jgi:membrane-bound serine protease (ClpP class)
MKRKRYRLGALIFLAAGAWLTTAAQSPQQGGVVVLSLADAVSRATSSYLVKGIRDAAADDAELIVIEMDTPGGLDSSMREIIQAILDSPVPVASFVYPRGARADSAGVYILYASHIAAMTAATNVGSCTPVDLSGGGGGSGGQAEPDDQPGDGAGPGGVADETAGDVPPNANGPAVPVPATTMERKVVNDAVAYIRSLAEHRGRNADWAESCVRAATNLTAQAALREGVIDLIAADRADLLRQLDGRVIDGTRLSLPASILVREVMPDWRTRLLAVITNPTVAMMLLVLGGYGLLLEGYNPGAILPGVVGAISILVALFALQILPVNYAGLALMLLGMILMIAEFFVPSFGALGFGGIAAFVIGGLVLFDADVPGFEVARSAVGGIALAGALAMMGTIWLAMRSRRHKVVSGIEEMLGLTAEALEDFDAEGAGTVWVHGERWQARAAIPVSKGQKLKVRQVDGLTLEVEPARGT